MECPNCHHWNEAGARFCEECGFELSAVPTGPAQVSISQVEPSAFSPADPPEDIPEPPVQALIPVAPPAPPVDKGACLVLNSSGSIFKLGNLTLIGREDPTVQIDFDGYQDGKYVSHRHAQIVKNDDLYAIEDLKSSNHTWVNGVKLSAGQSEPLHEGDKVRFGKIEVTFRGS